MSPISVGSSVPALKTNPTPLVFLTTPCFWFCRQTTGFETHLVACGVGKKVELFSIFLNVWPVGPFSLQVLFISDYPYLFMILWDCQYVVVQILVLDNIFRFSLFLCQIAQIQHWLESGESWMVQLKLSHKEKISQKQI